MAKHKTLEVIEVISRIVGEKGFDGALHEDGEKVEIGLTREEGHPLFNSRTVDGFKVSFLGDKMCVKYHTQVPVHSVHQSKDFDGDIEEKINQIAKFLKKEYKKLSGSTLSLSEEKKSYKSGFQSASSINSWVQAEKWYKLNDVDSVDYRDDEDKSKLDKAVKSWLELANKAKRPENEEIKASDNEREDLE